MILAIDPGLSTGWCVLSGPAGIVDCGLGEVWPLDSWGMVEWTAVIERPEVYNTRFQKGDPNDLITLAIRVGRYVERLAARGIQCEEVLPKKWKGTIDKPVHHNRAREKMSENEIKIADEACTHLSKKATLDVWDAVCLALWKAGRLPRQGF